MKTCCICLLALPTSKFSKNVQQADNLNPRCRDCYNGYNRISVANSKAFGVCTKISCRDVPFSHSYLCQEHYFKQFAPVSELYSKWVLLRDLAESQDYKCALSGSELIPGISMSLDHIKPRSKFPELSSDINNLQFVTLEINVMKRALDLDYFISVCSSIHRHSSNS